MGQKLNEWYYRYIWPLWYRPLTVNEFYKLKDQNPVTFKMGTGNTLAIATGQMFGEHSGSSGRIIIQQVLFKGSKSHCKTGTEYVVQAHELYTEREYIAPIYMYGRPFSM